MSTVPRRIYTLREYEEAARAYQETLTFEDILESPDQGTQRKITLASLALVQARRADVHVFNELLVQYLRGRSADIQRVVPDNLVVLHDGKIELDHGLALHLQLHPGLNLFWALEYISRQSKEKDREISFKKYERDLKIPYYLLFDPEQQEMLLWRLRNRKYVSVKPNAHGRCEIAELNLGLAIHEGWVRFWHEDRLLPLPADLLHALEAANQRADNAEKRADKAEQELARLRAQLGLPPV